MVLKMNIKDLDEIIDFKKRKLMVLGGTYGIGKSTVALNIATNIAQQDVSVMIFKERLSKKIGDSNNIFICNIPRISIKKICEKN
jgi:predicted ATP-dependent serine protease